MILRLRPRKKWNVKSAMHNEAWIVKVCLNGDFLLEHHRQFIDVWVKLWEAILKKAWRTPSRGGSWQIENT
jgi:hypothetical protein